MKTISTVVAPLKKLRTGFNSLKKPVKTWLEALGLIAGASTIIIPSILFVTNWYKGWGTVELPDAYPNEVWKNASAEDYGWLEGDWFYPSLPDFYTRYKIEDETLFQQNYASTFQTEWIQVKIFISNKNVLRVRYVSNDWPGTYIQKREDKRFEFYNYERYLADDGTVSTGQERLVLNRNACRVSKDGLIYECN